MTNEFSEPPLEFRIMPLVQPSPTNDPVDKELIRKICENGLSECPDEDRCFAWLVLLNVFPRYAVEWPDRLSDMIKKYHDFVSDYGVSDWTEKTFPSIVRADNMSVSQPKLMLTIYSDIARSGRQFFFFPAIEPPNDAPDDKLSFFIPHIRRLERILYIFAMLNPSLSYMQGFNELAIPFYYVMLQPNREKNAEISSEILDEVEALTFYCFQKLMTDTSLPELYTTQDQSSIIMHQLNKFVNLMHTHLPETAEAIEALQIHPIFYCLRWFTLLFAQEHDLPSLLVIWDSLFAHFSTFIDYIFYVGLGHLKMVENRINKNYYSQTIEALQHLNVSGKVKDILEYANEYWEIDKQRK